MTNQKNIGELTTFSQLITNNTIVIPKVQRDYAYGRKEQKVKEVLDGILTSVLGAIKNNTIDILDFVYGGSEVRKDNDGAGMIPLDGQQRLTTLFLLYFYASLLGDDDGQPIEKSEVDMLLKFRYETRQSATQFCHSLVDGIRDNLLKNKYQPQNKNIKTLIVDDALYFGMYDNDPTIASMLNVLDKIEEKCIDMGIVNLQPCLWKRLWERENIKFYNLSLENFGLTDDLFIKMNARGKKLTKFEIFKSDVISAIKKLGDDKLKDEFSIKIDTKWIDIVWENIDTKITETRKALDITSEADKKYETLFRNIFLIEYYRRDLLQNGLTEPTIETILSDQQSITSVIELFDFLYNVHKNPGGFKNKWGMYFYSSKDIVGKTDKIRLFWQQQKQEMSVFDLALQGDLTIAEIIYMYSLFRLYKQNASKDVCEKCLRVIRNLIMASAKVGDARKEKLHDFMQEVKYIIDNNGAIPEYNNENSVNIDGKPHKLAFLQHVWNEEYNKQQYSVEEYQELLKYENHDILRGSLKLFMDYCDNDISKLNRLLEKFEKLFNNSYNEHFQEIRLLFIDKQNNYIQYDAKGNLCYLLTEAGNLNSFFTWSNIRTKQENILKILDNMQVPTPLSSVNTRHAQFNKYKDWQYYMVKYPNDAIREGTKYGMAVWDDVNNFPLDLILLNSSYHSENNWEWMMLTRLLYRIINPENQHPEYHLDDHGCHPIQINTSSIGFKNGEWQVCTDQKLDQICSNYPFMQITIKSSEEYSVALSLQANEDYDYINLGVQLVELITN